MHPRNTCTDKDRSYGGVSSPERREARRERIIDAAIRVYGQVGRNATVKGICAEAGLTERYFYESFSSLEALAISAMEMLSQRLLVRLDAIAQAHAEASPEVRMRAVLEAFYSDFKSDPVRARLFVIEMAHLGPAAEEQASIARRNLGAFLDRALAPGRTVDEGEGCDLARAGAVGAVIQILKAWVHAEHRASLDAVVAEALKHCRLLAR